MLARGVERVPLAHHRHFRSYSRNMGDAVIRRRSVLAY